MRNKPLSYLPSGDYVINSLVDDPNGNRFITGAMGRILAIVPSPGFSPQKLHVELVDGSKHIYVITVDDKNTRDEDHLVYASHREAQKWDITYRQQWNAYTVVKLGTREAWTDISQDDGDGHRDSDGPHQVMPIHLLCHVNFMHFTSDSP
ncbi:hypothetical protein EDC04DRAFT_2682710 [Pisolithus marmoratus]|nr:hypothetical protein EDC04DRAFT_2682710 [Pisolithus marmoratus]